MAKYEDVYDDHCYLWGIGPANDMTGGYVDQEALDRLLKNPTKSTAKGILLDQIEYWFSVGVENNHGNNGIDPHEFEDEYPRIREIAEKYGFDF